MSTVIECSRCSRSVSAADAQNRDDEEFVCEECIKKELLEDSGDPNEVADDDPAEEPNEESEPSTNADAGKLLMAVAGAWFVINLALDRFSVLAMIAFGLGLLSVVIESQR